MSFISKWLNCWLLMTELVETCLFLSYFFHLNLILIPPLFFFSQSFLYLGDTKLYSNQLYSCCVDSAPCESLSCCLSPCLPRQEEPTLWLFTVTVSRISLSFVYKSIRGWSRQLLSFEFSSSWEDPLHHQHPLLTFLYHRCSFFSAGVGNWLQTLLIDQHLHHLLFRKPCIFVSDSGLKS